MSATAGISFVQGLLDLSITYSAQPDKDGTKRPSRFLRSIEELLARGGRLWHELEHPDKYMYPISIDRASDFAQYGNYPQRIILDATEYLLAEPDLIHIERVVRGLSGFFPVEVRLASDGDFEYCDVGTVCGQPEALAILRQETGLPVVCEPLDRSNGCDND